MLSTEYVSPKYEYSTLKFNPYYRRVGKLSNADEINLLMERALETYSMACELHQNHHYNDAVSRAYYSMFYAAKAVLLTKGIISRTHRGTISQLNINFVLEGELEETVWKYLPMSDTLIQEADYSITKRITQKESEEILEVQISL